MFWLLGLLDPGRLSLSGTAHWLAPPLAKAACFPNTFPYNRVPVAQRLSSTGSVSVMPASHAFPDSWLAVGRHDGYTAVR